MSDRASVDGRCSETDVDLQRRSKDDSLDGRTGNSAVFRTWSLTRNSEDTTGQASDTSGKAIQLR